jgi:hypothetical protein
VPVVYSLVNVAALIRDLARLPAGPALAADLRQAFALTPPDLEVLDALGRQVSPADGVRRAAVLRADASRPPALTLLAAARSAADTHGLAAYGGSLDVLAAATIGGLEDLVRFVRHDLLAAAWSGDGDLRVASYPAALDVVTDGIVATWAGRADIGRAWRRWCGAHGEPPPAAGHLLIVDAVRRIPAAIALAPAVPAEWAQHMHEACWAVHLSGRERTAAVTQLCALQALFRVSAPAAPSHALVATVVAAVHACAASDLLPTETYDAMTQPLFSLLP